MVHAEIHINLPILLCAASRGVIVEALLNVILLENKQILIDTETFLSRVGPMAHICYLAGTCPAEPLSCPLHG